VSNTWLSFCSFKKGDVIEILSKGVDPVCLCVYIGLLFSSCLCTWPIGTQPAHYYQEGKHVIQLTEPSTVSGMVLQQGWLRGSLNGKTGILPNTHVTAIEPEKPAYPDIKPNRLSSRTASSLSRAEHPRVEGEELSKRKKVVAMYDFDISHDDELRCECSPSCPSHLSV
jgi:hypothetical protein